MKGLKSTRFWVAAGAFLATSGWALLERWSLPEFCWTTWLTGLVYAWACVVSGAVQVVWTARRDRRDYADFHPALGRISQGAFLLVVTAAVAVAASLALYVYTYIYSFYGLFLSVFAEMKDNPMFVRNGYINSDFWSPVMYLLERFWPMVLAALAANGMDLAAVKPWWRILLPILSNEVLRVHLFVLALPVVTLLAWALFKTDYQPVTVVLLLGLFFLVPRGRSKEAQKAYYKEAGG